VALEASTPQFGLFGAAQGIYSSRPELCVMAEEKLSNRAFGEAPFLARKISGRH
jgi:hypothetical protein